MRKILYFLILAIVLTGCFPKPAPAAPPPPTETPIPPTPTPGVGDTLGRQSDGATMVYVPAATFEMGIAGGEKGNPAHLVSLDSYWIDRTEVTNRAFAAFLNSYPGLTITSATQWFDAWSGSSRLVFADGQWSVSEDFADHPVTVVNWLGAQAYCFWAGARLPTEAEWELAARGPQGLANPTGQGVACEQAHVCGSEPAASGSFDQDTSPYGALDMGGNVMEWVADWYHPYYYESEITFNPRGPLYGTNKVLRGGFYLTSFPAYDRMEISPSYAEPGTGFRCAKSATEAAAPAAPQLYPVEACMQGAGTECVVGLSRRESGEVQINFLWDVASNECLTNTGGTANLYLVDDLGNRIDPIGLANYSGNTCVRNSVGHLLFPKLNDQAAWLVFYDDNQGVSSNPIPLLWVNQAASGAQPTFAPTPRPLAERFSQMATYNVREGASRLAWSPDGRSLMVAAAGGLSILDAASGSPWPALNAGGMQVAAVDGAWSPDGSRLAVTDGLDLHMFDGIGATFFYSLTLPAAVRQLVWSPDGKTLAAVLGDGSVRLVNASAAQIGKTINQFSDASYIAWSPDGEKLVIQAGDGCHLWRVTDAQTLAHWDHLLTPAWSPDSTWIAGWFQQQVLLQNAVTGERFTADAPEFSPTSSSPLVGWSPGGRYFATGNLNAITIWSVESSVRQAGSLAGHNAAVIGLTFSPDGNTLASLSSDGALILWSIAGE